MSRTFQSLLLPSLDAVARSLGKPEELVGDVGETSASPAASFDLAREIFCTDGARWTDAGGAEVDFGAAQRVSVKKRQCFFAPSSADASPADSSGSSAEATLMVGVEATAGGEGLRASLGVPERSAARERGEAVAVAMGGAEEPAGERGAKTDEAAAPCAARAFS